MWKETLLVAVSGLLVLCVAENFVCEGTWKVYRVAKCENPEQFEWDYEFHKRRINRTHDGFTFVIDLKEDFTADGFGIQMELYKKVDGGYRYMENMDNPSLCAFVNQFTPDNFEMALQMAGVNPPNCPAPKGKLEMKDFVVDYTKLPKQAKCGEFKTIVYILQGEKKIFCAIIYSAFTANDDDDLDDD